MQYVLNVVFTIPAIIYIDRWGRRPMLLIGTFLMGFWLMLVGGLQGGFGHWGTVDGSRKSFTLHHYDIRSTQALSHRRLGDRRS